ncbi:NAD(P)H-hydrate dehydratase [Candidatus Nanohalovita haloferacivicina]|uniref:NAD(P)H-hydrate dehydratase n=1 Tax=Candidatus Nanohalovita haloferacivicina TaxID=2978046 RepID=UPI00325FD8D2|nr:ADP-dependent NAD(P)H-hydrate dehydratase, ribokinase, fructokinase, ketohexokinase, 2-dehydro-3-deoxygluconokinase, 1-phosphofructokinase [Candidatus Nanohalobia archaeon BNXNv]
MQELFEKLSRDEDSHKGQNGKVMVIGGSEKYTGAPALTAQAALRAGADLVKVLTSDHARPVVQGFSENLIVESFGERFDENSLEKALELEEWADTTVVGPGLTDFDKNALRDFAEEAGNLVVDAGAIRPLRRVKAVFTPHAGEAKILEKNYGSLKAFSEETGSTVLLKGGIDTIYSSAGVFENETGCAGMTAGGTGDVLAGIVTAFHAQGLEDKDAARLAAYINGVAGEKAFEKYGNGLVASDLLERIAEVVSEKS